MINKVHKFILVASLLLICSFTFYYNKYLQNTELAENENGAQVINKTINNEFSGNNSINFSNSTFKDTTKGIPVLMYHSIDYEKNNELRLPKEKFKQQMQYLKDNNYTTLTLNQFYKFLYSKKPIPKKSIIITLDDGYKDNYTNAYSILKELNFNATIFVVTSTIDKDINCLTSKQILELNENGIDIQSHTHNHDNLPTLNYTDQLNTLKKSKDILESILKKDINYISYPYGKYNHNTIKATKESGYKIAFRDSGYFADINDGLYSLDRIYIKATLTLDEFKKKISTNNK